VGMDWTAFIKSDGGSSGDREMGLKRIVTGLEALLARSYSSAVGCMGTGLIGLYSLQVN